MRIPRHIVKLLRITMALMILVTGVGLGQSSTAAAATSAKSVRIEAKDSSKPAELPRAIRPLAGDDLAALIAKRSTSESTAPETQDMTYRPALPLPTLTHAVPTPSGATSPVPLNNLFDVSPFDHKGLVPNQGFEQDAYVTGTPPANYDFETGNLSNWTTEGTVSMVSGGPTGYYAQLAASGRLTTTAFTVPDDAQTITVDAKTNASAAFYIYVASGPNYSTLTQIFYVYYKTSWETFRFGAGPWRGQSIKIFIKGFVGNGYVDNVGVSNVVAPQWSGSGWLAQVDGGPTGRYLKMGERASITSQAFTVPTDGHLLTMDLVSGAGGAQTYIYVLSGPDYSTSTRIGALYVPASWQNFSWDITQWRGQSIKVVIEYFVNGLWVGLDNAAIVRSVAPNWSASKAPQLMSGGPWDNYIQISPISAAAYSEMTSAPFTIPGQATVLQIDIKVGTSASVSILSGPSYGTSTTVLNGVTPYNWQRYNIDVSQWAGESVKIVLRAGSGTSWGAAFDNVGANLIEETCGDECYPSADVGGPVDTSTGAESLSATDLTIPGRGVPIEFSRSYFSASTYTGTLGFRWMHNYEVNLSVGTDLTATVRYASGSIARFKKSGSNYISPPGNYDSLVQNGDGTYTLTNKQQIRYNFPSGGGALQSIQDRNGNTTTLGYTSGLLSTITDPGGRSISLSYDANNRISTITDPLNRTVQYGYSAAGDLVTVTNTAGEITQYTYDNHRLVSAIDNAGKTLFYNYYDNANRVITQTMASAYTTTFAYNTPSAGQTTVTDPRGNSTIYFYDTSFRTSNVQDAYGNYVSYGYDTNNRVITATNQLGQSTYYGYDSVGNLTRKTDALGKTWVYTYTALNDLAATTDPLGRTTSYGYDTAGNLTSVTNAANKTTSFGRDAHGQLTSITDPLGRVTQFEYDNYGNQTAIVDNAGKRTTQQIDIVGRMTSRTDPLNHTISFAYDSGNRLVSATDALSNTVSYGYDAVGNRTVVTDANGNAMCYGYDEKNNLKVVTDTLGNVTTYGYDANDNRISVTDALSRTTRYDYDALNRLIKVTTPLSTTTIYGYDGVGNRTVMTDSNGSRITYAYDNINRLTQVNYPDSTVKYSYNAVNQRTIMTDTVGTTTYSYDDVGRLITATFPNNVVVGYSYNDAGQRTKITYPDGKQVSYGYDAVGRLSTVTDWASRVVTYTYDDAGRVTGAAFPNGVNTSYSYDAANRLTDLSHLDGSSNTINSFSYALDNIGSRLAMTDTLGTTNYSYDNLYRLTQVNYPDQTSVSYQYDNVGNRLVMTDTLGTTNYAYDALDRMQSAGQATFTWDANGNMTGKITPSSNITYTYDYANRLTTVISDSNTITYTYDGDGNRASKSVNGNVSHYVYDIASGLPQVLVDGEGSYYIYGLELIAKVQNPGDPGGGTPSYYHTDGLGTIRNLTDATGQAIVSYEYDAFGGLKSVTGTLANEFRFTGEQWDDDAGLYYLRARYYDPSTGRFISRDPFPGMTKDPSSQHRYAYVQNNPVNFVDPTGEFAWALAGAAIGGGIDLAVQLYANGGDWSKVNWVSVGGSAVAGAAGVGIGAGVAKLTANVGIRVALNGLGSAAVGGATTAAQNAICGDPLEKNVGRNAAVSGVFGAFGGAIGEAPRAIATFRASSWWKNASLADKTFASTNAVIVPNEPALGGFWTGFANAAAVTVSNSGPALQLAPIRIGE